MLIIVHPYCTHSSQMFPRPDTASPDRVLVVHRYTTAAGGLPRPSPCVTPPSRLQGLTQRPRFSSTAKDAGQRWRRPGASTHTRKRLSLSLSLSRSMSEVPRSRRVWPCVMGLSVVAITYYSTGVMGYLAKAASVTVGLPVPVELALGLSIPAGPSPYCSFAIELTSQELVCYGSIFELWAIPRTLHGLRPQRFSRCPQLVTRALR